MYKLILSDDARRLNEIFQTISLKMAYCIKSDADPSIMIQINQPGKCRDFLGDIPWSRATKKPVEVFGMKYDYATHPYDLETTRLSLKFPSKTSMANFKNNFHRLTELEQKYGIPESKWTETDDSHTLIIEGHKQWQSITWKISLYTFYIKLLSYKNPDVPDEPESEYLAQYTPEMRHLLLSNVMVDMNYFYPEIYANHNYSGFVSLISCIKAIKGNNNYSGWTPDFMKIKEVALKVLEKEKELEVAE